jgi:hypothetical protein
MSFHAAARFGVVHLQLVVATSFRTGGRRLPLRINETNDPVPRSLQPVTSRTLPEVLPSDHFSLPDDVIDSYRRGVHKSNSGPDNRRVSARLAAHETFPDRTVA